jgi:hypothetical protein
MELFLFLIQLVVQKLPPVVSDPLLDRVVESSYRPLSFAFVGTSFVFLHLQVDSKGAPFSSAISVNYGEANI